MSKPESEDMICDCCFRCEIHCLCDESCENTFTKAKIGEECPICAVEDKE